MAEKRPNVLFLMSDEHRFDAAGFSGNKVVRTPHLDRLAADAVVFDNAYTPSPVCIPARQCLMAGKWPGNCGCTDFSHDLEPGTDTFAAAFSRVAYNTVAVGKLHHTGSDQMQGWRRRIAGDCELGGRWVENRDEAAFAEIRAGEPEPFYTASGRGKNRWEVERAGVGVSPHGEFDSLAVQGAESFIRNSFANIYYDRIAPHCPLLLKVSLIKPHYPFLTQEKLFEYYINRVPVFPDAPFPHRFLGRNQAQEYVRIAERDRRRATAAYYGMVEELDADFGRVLAALENVGENIDDWLVVYCSDHGEMLGEHGIWEKGNFFEGSVRVPLFIRPPKSMNIAPRRIGENVNLIDLYATLGELCRVPVPDGLDGRSLASLMRGENVGWNDETASRYGDRVMIKRGKLKYQYYGDAGGEVLFDLGRDPGETENFAAAPEYAGFLEYCRSRKQEI